MWGQGIEYRACFWWQTISLPHSQVHWAPVSPTKSEAPCSPLAYSPLMTPDYRKAEKVPFLKSPLGREDSALHRWEKSQVE